MFDSSVECFSGRRDALVAHLVLSTLHGEVFFNEDAVCGGKGGGKGVRDAPATHPQDTAAPKAQQTSGVGDISAS